MRGKIKNVALIGFGAMGSWFAPKLYRCLGNDHFAVIASGDRKKRLEEKGVSINNVNYKFNIIEPSKGKPVDLIIMAVKEMGLANAIKDIEKFVGKETQIMCVMNGVTSEDEIAAVYGYEHVLYSYMRVSIVMTAGVTNYDPNLGRVYVGEKVNDNENNGENHTQRVKAVEELFTNANISHKVLEDMIYGIWFKFMCNVGENMTCALLNIPFGAYIVSEAASNIRVAAMKEVKAIANAKGINLTERDMASQFETLKILPAKNIPSTRQDLNAKKKTEVDMFAGSVVKMGKELDIETPISWFFLNAISVLEEQNEGKFEFE